MDNEFVSKVEDDARCHLIGMPLVEIVPGFDLHPVWHLKLGVRGGSQVRLIFWRLEPLSIPSTYKVFSKSDKVMAKKDIESMTVAH